ncbi:MAG: glycosyltransferase family 4 protein [Saprospiraceae bacterium]
MKILLITNVYDSEVVGPARFARLLHDSNNIKVDILTANSKNENVYSFDLRLSYLKSKFGMYFSIAEFQNQLLKVEHNYDFLLFNNALLAYQLTTNIPYAVMVNDAKLIDNQVRWKFDYLRRSVYRIIENAVVHKSKKVIVNSPFLKQKIAEAYNKNENDIFVLLKGINLNNKLSPYAHWELSMKKNVKILFVKNDYKIGGLEYLIDALALLADYSFELTIIGTDNSVRNILKETKNIKYNILGYQSNDIVIQNMYKHDILSIPATVEPLGVAIMEGLAVGIPVVTTGTGGLPVVTNNGENVWECYPKNAKSISQQIYFCLQNKNSRIEKSKKGKLYIHENFDFAKVENRIIEIIDKV